MSGYEDCSDGSDENTTICHGYPCPEYMFRCSYGGCIHQELVCDGVKDCVDGADEDSSICQATDCEEKECEQYKCRLVQWYIIILISVAFFAENLCYFWQTNQIYFVQLNYDWDPLISTDTFL